MTPETGPDDTFDALPPELAGIRGTVVVAPNGTVNTGTVHGDQRYAMTDSPAPAGTGVPLARQGPVRAKDLQAARLRFVRPAGYAAGLDALGSGVLFVTGAPGTGRQTLALNLLAHGCADAALVQIDGAVNLAHWRPRARGVRGYLVMNLTDPLSLRPWDISRLEAHLEKAGARLVVVLRETTELARVLEDRLDVTVLRHRPPDPVKVFSLHYADLCPDAGERARRRARVGPRALAALLPSGLPPGRAVRVAEALALTGPEDRMTAAALTARLAAVEAARLVAEAEGDPTLLAHLLSTCVHQGLGRDTVLGRAAELLSVIRVHHDPGCPPQATADDGDTGRPARALRRSADAWASGNEPTRTSAAQDVLADIGAGCTAGEDGDGGGTVAFLWPAVSEAVWDEVCRERAEWLPFLHAWLGRAQDEEQTECAGRAVAALAARTAGRSLGLLADLVRTGPETAAEVVGLALNASSRLSPAAARAHALLDEWSGAPEPALRSAVVAACRPDTEGLPAEAAMRLLRTVVAALGDDDEAAATALRVSGTLVHRFTTGAMGTREAVVRALAAWSETEDVAGLLATLTFPALVAEDHGWFGERLSAGQETGPHIVALVCAALDEAAAYGAMRDALLTWCAGAVGSPEREHQLDELFTRLVGSRRPGCLRLLLSIERAPDTTPGKALAERSLTEWRGGSGPAADDRPA
ncbi:hypothetical protein [Streptomyces dangxiongensis]|uniref:hypothetical protein n=1 Tax=Streptomyces dangxiongensis TaxID=1442032 RepID=UPI0013CE4BBA|nr:hypothetical protein [Streptomyces dangxiongensis]